MIQPLFFQIELGLNFMIRPVSGFCLFIHREIVWDDSRVRCLVTSGFRDRAFAHAAPQLWNSLPLDVRNCENISVFKKRLKTFLFNKAYNPL